MAYGQWKINEKMTIEEFGYTSSNLSKGSKYPVKVVCESCGMIANKRLREANRKHVCKSIIDDNKKCFKCKTIKNISEFSKNRTTFDGYQKVCKDCFSNYECVKRGYKTKSIKYKTTLTQYFSHKITNAKKKSEIKNLPFDLDVNFLLELYKNQNGKCFYTGIEIMHNIGVCSFNSISLDRINPGNGYIKDNVVFCANGINSFKGNSTIEEFKEILRTVIPVLKEFSER